MSGLEVGGFTHSLYPFLFVGGYLTSNLIAYPHFGCWLFRVTRGTGFLCATKYLYYFTTTTIYEFTCCVFKHARARAWIDSTYIQLYKVKLASGNHFASSPHDERGVNSRLCMCLWLTALWFVMQICANAHMCHSPTYERKRERERRDARIH